MSIKDGTGYDWMGLFFVFYDYNHHVFGSKLETLIVESINLTRVLDPEPVLTSLGP